MSLPATSARTSAKRTFLAHVGRQTWAEIAWGSLLLAAAAAIWWHRGQMSLPKQVALYALVLVGSTVLLRRVWSQLFGPVLFYDLIRLGRRNRFFLLRCLYAAALLLVLAWAYDRFLESLNTWRGPGFNPYQARRTLQADDVARLAEGFFSTFMAMQFAAVLLLTPAYTAGAISEEKDRKTLEFLLATDLNNREIVLSKLLARVANLTLLILTGLPILSLTQFLGGVDPNLVIAGFAATALTMLSLASFSILCSVYVRKPRDAIVLTYLGAAAYLAVTLLAEQALAAAKLSKTGLADCVTAGNLFSALAHLREAVAAGTDLATVIPGLLRNYALFHGAVALACIAWAIVRLRALGLRQQLQAPRKGATPGRWGRPRVGRLPMLWKELFIEPGFRLGWLGWVLVLIAVIISLLPAAYIISEYLLGSLGSQWTAQPTPFGPRPMMGGFALGDHLQGWVRITSTIVLCLLLIGVAVRASSSVSGERDRETMDGLLTSPLESHDILFAKWLGSCLSIRWFWLWPGLIWAIGIASGALHPLAIPMLLSAWVVYAGALSGLGLWFSTSSPTTTKATLSTLTVTGLLGVGHLLLLFFCCGFNSSAGWVMQSTITPPPILYWLTASDRDMGKMDWDIGFVCAMFGLMAWAVAAAVLWNATRTHFRALTSRMARPRIATAREAARSVSIGGLLLLPAIDLGLRVLFHLFALLFMGIRVFLDLGSTRHMYGGPGGNAPYGPGEGAVVIAMALHSVFLPFTLYVAFLFFTRSQRAPKAYMLLLLASLVAGCAPLLRWGDSPEILLLCASAAFWTGVWVWYFLVSQRVRATFTKP
jgi:ABC-type transport system involved in multi-copper enzyme maturation permease subunit